MAIHFRRKCKLQATDLNLFFLLHSTMLLKAREVIAMECCYTYAQYSKVEDHPFSAPRDLFPYLV
jgi:hypothetical protein